MRTFRSGGWILPALLAVVLPAMAQQAPQEQPPSVFGEQIDVRVVNVEAVVTDREGNRVQGLRPEDFRLRVDGKVVPIEYFNEVRGGQAIALGESESSPVKGLPSLAPGSPVGTSYLVFIDEFFSLQPRRNEVLRALKDELSRLGPEDRMAIVAFNGGGVEMLSSWSNSSRQLGQAIEQAIGRPAAGAARRMELQSFESTRRIGSDPFVRANPRGAFVQRMDIEELEFANRVAFQVERAVVAAASTLRGFASPPGRKVMLLLSGGWPYSPAEYVINNPNRPVAERDIPDGEDLMGPLVDTANRLGYTIYPIDVPGVESGTVDASMAEPSTGSLNLREQEHHSTLMYVAEQTGGEALLNSRGLRALETAASDTRSYYWLGFTPTWEGNDKRHEVQVEVTRPGLRIRSRDSFLDLSRKAETSMMVESAMLFGGAPEAAAMPIQLGKPVAAGRREMEVPVSLAIPADAITMVPLNGKQTAELELRVAVVDDRGNRAPMPVIPFTLTANEVPKAGTYIRYDTKLRLRKAPHSLTLAIFDPLSGKLLIAKTDVAPPAK